jgi:hypothetical protein
LGFAQVLLGGRDIGHEMISGIASRVGPRTRKKALWRGSES